MNVRYTVSLTITEPIDPPDEPPEAWLTQRTKTMLEHKILRLLKPLDGDADCEVMAATLVDDDGEKAEGR